MDNNTIFIPITLSTSGDMEPFWGAKLVLPLARFDDTGNIIVLMSENDVINEFKRYLTNVCRPLPLLVDKISYLKLSFGDSLESIVSNYLQNPTADIYLCDHNCCRFSL